MWPFDRKYSFAGSGILRGFTDWHSHILPGVDDGVRTMAEALDILAAYGELGVSDVWLTPHVMEDMPNTTECLQERFGELGAVYGGPVRLHLAAEYMLDNLFRERLAAGDMLPLGERGDRLLVETSYYNPPADLYGLLDRIKAGGFHPVLAHAERYIYMDREDYRRLKDAGVRFQLNLPSLAGAYGRHTRERAVWMLGKGYYDFCGTDVHSPEHWSGIIHAAAVGRKEISILRASRQNGRIL